MSSQPPKRTRKQTDSPNKEHICVSCSKKATKNAIECDRCGEWEHKMCAQVSDDMYKLINEVPKNIKFFCTPCCSVIATLMEVDSSLDSAILMLKEKLENLELKFCNSLQDVQTHLSDRVRELELNFQGSDVANKVSDHIKALELKVQGSIEQLELKLQGLDIVNKLSDQITELEQKVQGSSDQIKELELKVQGSNVADQLKEIETRLHKPIEQHLKSMEVNTKKAKEATLDTASRVVDEYRDMERRKWNLIVFNIPEPKSREPSQRKAEDRETLNAIMKDIGVGSVDIAEVVRLGAITVNKIRPLRVQFTNLSHRRSVLANAKRLRDSSSGVFKGIYINPDLSVKERQAQRELRLELTRRKQNGESGIFIRGGRIIKFTRTENHIYGHPQRPTLEAMDNQSA